MNAKSFTVTVSGNISKMFVQFIKVNSGKKKKILITIKRKISLKYFLDLIPESKWPNVLFSGGALGSMKVRTMSIVGVAIQAFKKSFSVCFSFCLLSVLCHSRSDCKWH